MSFILLHDAEDNKPILLNVDFICAVEGNVTIEWGMPPVTALYLSQGVTRYEQYVSESLEEIMLMLPGPSVIAS